MRKGSRSRTRPHFVRKAERFLNCHHAQAVPDFLRGRNADQPSPLQPSRARDGHGKSLPCKIRGSISGRRQSAMSAALIETIALMSRKIGNSASIAANRQIVLIARTAPGCAMRRDSLRRTRAAAGAAWISECRVHNRHGVFAAMLRAGQSLFRHRFQTAIRASEDRCSAVRETLHQDRPRSRQRSAPRSRPFAPDG